MIPVLQTVTVLATHVANIDKSGQSRHMSRFVPGRPCPSTTGTSDQVASSNITELEQTMNMTYYAQTVVSGLSGYIRDVPGRRQHAGAPTARSNPSAPLMFERVPSCQPPEMRKPTTSAGFSCFCSHAAAVVVDRTEMANSDLNWHIQTAASHASGGD